MHSEATRLATLVEYHYPDIAASHDRQVRCPVETFVPAMNAPPCMGIPLRPAAEGQSSEIVAYWLET
jgi:hypothetical protein